MNARFCNKCSRDLVRYMDDGCDSRACPKQEYRAAAAIAVSQQCVHYRGVAQIPCRSVGEKGECPCWDAAWAVVEALA